MWILLKENIQNSDFKMDNNSTYLLKIDKTNFLVGKNNSGKSYFLRFLLKNVVRVYKDRLELFEDLKKVLIEDNNLTFQYFNNFNNKSLKQLHDKYYYLVDLLNKADEAKIDTGSTYVGSGKKAYEYINIDKLLEELKPLFEYLNVNQNETNLNIKIISRCEEIKLEIFNSFKKELADNLDILGETDIILFGTEMTNVIKDSINIERYYFPILRNIRHPLKYIDCIGNENTKQDIYKERIISEYKFQNDINIITGLNFYQDYKNNLLGTKDKRKKINDFEKFLSSYFFNGENVSIIPDEETFEIKININDSEDKFIYQVGDGITSLIIIMYTIFMEYCPDEYKIFFIEEPENNFHPGFQRLFINMITYFKKFEKCIFIITTHSNHLIDIGNRENKSSLVYLCQKEEKRIIVSEKDEEYYDVLDELGIQASSVLLANKVIWVEGKYDAFYIRLLLNLKNINRNEEEKFIEDYDYCFIPYGGNNMSLINFEPQSINHDVQEEFIVKARKINSKYMVVLDDDNMFEKQKKVKVQRYEKLSRCLGSYIYKLQVREIENLFPEEVIEKYIKQGIKKEMCLDDRINKLSIQYDEYKSRKLGEYINEKLLETFKGKELKTITGRENGFEKDGFLYDKLKFYKCVVDWTKVEEFTYENKTTKEIRELINAIEDFIKNK